MAEINDLNVTDASNTARFPENQSPSSLNDGARALEGIVARWHKDINGSVAVAGTNTYTATINADTGLTLYDGFMFCGDFANANTGAATINLTPDGGTALGAKAIKKHGGTDLASGDIAAGAKVLMLYDGTNFQMISQLGNASLTSGDILDEDDMASDSATKVPSQQSTKAYVDARNGKQTIWVPAGAMRPTVSNGCAALVDVETTAGRPDLSVLDFDASSDEHAQFSVTFPKSWNAGTITFQVYWTSTATDTDGVTWALQGVACADGDTADVAYGTAVTVNDANQSTAEDVYVTAESGAVTIAGSPGDNEITFFRVFRDVSDANDTATEDARLIGVKLYFTTDAGNDQ